MSLRWAVFHRLRDLAWPVFDCADCIGMIHYGCQCAVYGAVAPGAPPGGIHEALRWLHGFLFPTSSQYWSDLHG